MYNNSIIKCTKQTPSKLRSAPEGGFRGSQSQWRVQKQKENLTGEKITKQRIQKMKNKEKIKNHFLT